MQIQDENDIDYKLLQKLEDRRYDRFSNTMKTVYGIFSVAIVVAGALFAYLNVTLVDRQEFSQFQASVTDKTIALVDREGGRISDHITEKLMPVLSQVTEIKNKFEESMEVFNGRISNVEKQVDLAKTQIDKTTFKTEDFYSFDQRNNISLNTIRSSVATLQSQISELRSLEGKVADRYTRIEHDQYAASQDFKLHTLMEKDSLLNEKSNSLVARITKLEEAIEKSFRDIDKRLLDLEYNRQDTRKVRK